MRRDVLDDAPAALARRIRTASVPAFLRALCLHLPARLVVDATLAIDAGRVPDTACSWIKLARTGTRVEIGALTFTDDARPTSLSVRAHDRVCVLDAGRLAGDFASSIEHVFAALFESADHVATLRAFAFQSSMLETLHTITHNMLATRDVPRALHVMLSGITSGYGLGFHRAALFVHDATENVFRGFRAIGPADHDDAHRIWEELELEDRPIEDLIDAGQLRVGETPFEQRVRELTLRVTDLDGDEISRALAMRGPQRFRPQHPVNPSLDALVQGTDFVLAAIRPRDRLLGLVYADNAFGGAAIPDEIEHLLGFFVDQTAVVWEHLSLLEHIDRLARFDALTNLPNRRSFETRIAAGAIEPAVLILIDVDRFKQFNDSAGHAAGDAVLRTVADVLRSCVPDDAMSARIGGDEFAVIVPFVDLAAANVLMNTIRVASADRGISLSLGAARAPDHAPTLSAVLAVADAQMYRAKEAGRGRSALPGETPEPPRR